MSSIKLKHSGGNSVSLNPPTSAPTSSDVAFKLPTSDGSAGQVLTTDGSGNLSWVTQPTAGITMADSWRINGGFNSSGNNVVATNWERADVYFDKIGTGMVSVDSNGKWTFPTTGLYLIDWQINFEGGSLNYAGGYIDATINNSAYSGIASQYSNIRNSANSFAGITCRCMFDVVNVTTHFVKLHVASSNQVYVQSDTNGQRTGVTFIRLGDT